MYIISYDDSGGTGLMDIQRVSYDEEVALLPNQFTKKNYIFVGWSLFPSNDESDVIYKDREKVKNLTEVNGDIITLYAVFVRDR